MSTEDYKPHPLLEIVAAAFSHIPVEPDEPIEEDGYGALGLTMAYGLIHDAAIQVAVARRAARGERVPTDRDDPNVTVDGCGDFRVEWTYNATPWEHDSRYADYCTVHEIVGEEELLKGIDLGAIRAKQAADKAEEERKRAELEKERAAKEALRKEALAALTPEQRQALGVS